MYQSAHLRISGVLKRKHLKISRNSIRYVGKESNELEKSEILGALKQDTIEYVEHQNKPRVIIKKLTLEKSLELGLSRRMYFYLKKKSQNKDIINLHSKTIRRISQAFPYC